VGQPAAKQGDQITATDIHIIIPPDGGSRSVPHPFAGPLSGNLSADVKIMGLPAATVGSEARNSPPHVPQGGSFRTPPTNQGTILQGSATVMINGKPAARNGDQAQTCADPTPNTGAKVVVSGGTVMIGG